MHSHSTGEYKRSELKMVGQVPDFQFTDFQGKKRRLSEFRCKYLLIDFWGAWCGPCRRELPYLKAAYRNFQPRGLEILGMNTDEPELLSQIKPWMEKNGLVWPHGRRTGLQISICLTGVLPAGGPCNGDRSGKAGCRRARPGESAVLRLGPY